VSTPPPPPEGLPRFFLDRSVGRKIVPTGLRQAGIELVTLAERYGVPADEQVTDVQWMRDAAAHDEAVLMCDDAIRKRNPAERAVLMETRLRAFVVSSQISGDEVVTRFTSNLSAIERACLLDGPFVYRLHPDRIERRVLKPGA
jgi:hypothetical protein